MVTPIAVSAVLPADGAADPELKTRESIVDRFGELDRQVAEFGPVLREHQALANKIRSWFDRRDPEREYVAKGKLYKVVVFARPREREIFSMARVYRILGRKRFIELATITLKLIERNIPEELHGRFLRSAATGTRRLQAVPKGAVVSIESGRPVAETSEELVKAA